MRLDEPLKLQHGRVQAKTSAPPDAAAPRTEASIRDALEHAFSLRHEDPERGEAIARAERAEAAGRGAAELVAIADIVLVYCADIEEDAFVTLEALIEAYRVVESAGNTRYQIRAGDMLSTIFEGSGDYPTALRYTETVLRLARSIGDRLFEGFALSSLAGILTATGDYDVAERKIGHAMTLARELEAPRLEARLLLRLGRVQLARDELSTAEEALERCRALSQEVPSLFTEVHALNELGRLYEARGQLERAESVLDEAERLSDADVQRIAGPKTTLGLARIYVKTKRFTEALARLHRLRSAAAGFSMMPLLTEGARLMAEVYEELGRPEQALTEFRRYVGLREASMEGEAQHAVNRFKVKIELETAQREAELERLRRAQLEAMQTQLVEAERMAAVGSLAAGVAHEMNTPLGVVRSDLATATRAVERLRAAMEDQAPSPAMERALSALESAGQTSWAATERLDGLVESLRRFTRLDEAELQALDLVEGLEATLALLRPTLPVGIQVEARLGPVPMLRGWPGRLNQAFLTLLMNAADALGESGCIRVETEAQADEAIVRIIDDGPGIPEDVQPRLFELSFEERASRTRFRVGLATVRSVVHRHGGEIRFETGADIGTTFEMRFPCGG